MYIPPVYYRGRYTRQLAKRIPRCAIACSSICWTEQQRPSPSVAAGTSAGLRGAHSPAGCIETHMRRNTCTRAFTRARTLALAVRRSGGRKLTGTGKLALRNGASRRYRETALPHMIAGNVGVEGSKQPSARDRPAETITYIYSSVRRRACKLHRT